MTIAALYVETGGGYFNLPGVEPWDEARDARAYPGPHPVVAHEGWSVADWQGGWTCRVEQGHYGHEAQKPTWLYAAHVDLPSLIWGRSSPEIPAHRSERWRARVAKDGVCVLLSRKDRAATPPAFRDMLLSIARTARPIAASEAA